MSEFSPGAVLSAAMLFLCVACSNDKVGDIPVTVAEKTQEPVVEQAVSDLPPAALPGGDTTFLELSPLSPLSADALSQPSGNLSSQQRMQFVVGNSFFTTPWITAGSSTSARDGLGPLFNAAACQDCHIRDGRGVPPVGPDDFITSAVIRIALPDGSPDPVYGRHIQTRAVPGLPAEAEVSVHWREHTETLADGSKVSLRKPEVRLRDWAYGAPDKALRASLRVAQSMTGLGLLEAIAADEIYARVNTQSSLGLRGIARQLNANADSEPLGRFGWKASQPSVRQQSLDAFVNDIGITSGVFPQEICTPPQLRQGCATIASGGEPELTKNIEDLLVFYARHLAPPVRRGYDRPEVQAGKKLFEELGCAGCHKPGWRTADSVDEPAFANQLIWPYTDMLLHDMGDGLADGISEGNATGRHWRTTPLWALGQVKAVGGPAAGYLHDGRARTLSEAILWHGGEAQAARNAWAALEKTKRLQLIAFLNSM